MRKTISFAKHYKDDYEYLNKKNNPSEYVCSLIRKDRLKNNENVDEKLLRLLQQVVNSGQIKNHTTQVSNKKKNALKNMLNVK